MTGGGKILFLTISGRNGASSRYRVYQFLPHLEKAGIVPVVMPPAPRPRGLGRLLSGMKENSRILEAASQADVVFIQKRLFGTGIVAALKKLGKPVVFDYDDSIFTSPSGGWSALTGARVRSRVKAVITASELVITGNRFLEKHARSVGAKDVVVLPTAVDASKYLVKEHRPGPLTLGWIGSSVNHRYLDMLSGALRQVSEKYDRLRLLVVSDKDYRMDGVAVENRIWSEDTEADDLLGMDIGLMPLADDDWTRGKCALKALQYMACGLPAVCSPVGANNEVVADGVDGLLPADDEAWVEGLSRLADSHELRMKMGMAGRAKAESIYGLDVVGARMAEILGGL